MFAETGDGFGAALCGHRTRARSPVGLRVGAVAGQRSRGRPTWSCESGWECTQDRPMSAMETTSAWR